MSLATLIRGKLRGSADVEKEISLGLQRDLHISKLLPDYATLVNEGLVWTVGQATATAAVTSLPTLTAGISLYNSEPDGGKSYVILKVGANQVGNGAAQASWHLAHLINVEKPTTIPTADILAASIKNLKARAGQYSGKAIVDLGATVIDDLWKPVGNSTGTVVVSLSGTAIEVPINGMVIVPPGGMYSLEAIASATGITVRMYFVWAEIQL